MKRDPSPARERRAAALRRLERAFASAAERVPVNKCLFDDPRIQRIVKRVDMITGTWPPARRHIK